jgi:hypothetical protein
LPAVTEQSSIRLNLLTAVGTPGTAIGAVAKPNKGFEVKSTSPLDASTYEYRVDSGNESNVATVSVDVQNLAAAPQVLTPLGVSNPASLPGETACTKMKAYSDGKSEYLYGYFTGASIVSVDIEGRNDVSPNDTGGNLFGRQEGNSPSQVTMLDLKPGSDSGGSH